ncbi:alpha/beta hydrolase [Nakamurella flava]|uniref:Alpha/beta hydrolase n=1 Tax=Nakamurella flava TaxID=2576308 RepID=A0A4U6QAU2_9ACTN|nr:alpha/beta hydrolase [Nakamurella flava]TKV57009.1 alpha/beta hydrolase [Nakamurella flava]
MTEITAHHGLFKDTNLHVDDTGGSGRPVVLIHGWPLSGEAWKDQVPAFADAGYRVVTYDRRGFGRSDKPLTGYTYDTLSEDLQSILEGLDLTDVTLVGFSMGGGEVARYLSKFGSDRIRSVVFASAVPPYLLKTGDNPDGPLEKSAAAKMAAQLTANQDEFYDQFTTEFFSANGVLKVTEQQRQEALALAHQASKPAALACMAAFGGTDFRDDLTKVTVPTLVIHGDADATVPFEGSGARTAAAIPGSEVKVISDAPHGVTVSHAPEWNEAVLDFLRRH